MSRLCAGIPLEQYTSDHVFMKAVGSVATAMGEMNGGSVAASAAAPELLLAYSTYYACFDSIPLLVSWLLKDDDDVDDDEDDADRGETRETRETKNEDTLRRLDGIEEELLKSLRRHHCKASISSGAENRRAHGVMATDVAAFALARTRQQAERGDEEDETMGICLRITGIRGGDLMVECFSQSGVGRGGGRHEKMTCSMLS